MNKIKYMILLITALCISYGYVFAQVNDNSGSSKKGTGSFSANIRTPLSIHSIMPPELTKPIQEYVRGLTTYTIHDKYGNTNVECHYDIRGDINNRVFIKVIVDDNLTWIGSGGNATKELPDGVKLFMKWKLINGDMYEYNGISNIGYNLEYQDGNPNDIYSGMTLIVQYVSLFIPSSATNGVHTFTQTIEVSYNEL